MRITRSAKRQRTGYVTSPKTIKTINQVSRKIRRKGSSVSVEPVAQSIATSSKSILDSGRARVIGVRDLQERFTYHSLDSKNNEIRLLQIRPSRKFDGVSCGIECNIVHASLDDKPEYDALSYAWGDLKELLSISLESHQFQVTANLHSALSHLQTSATNKPIWIDAICINQDDLEERSDQVVKMGDIFKHANTVYAWLGAADKESESAFYLLRRLKDCLQDKSRVLEILQNPEHLGNLYGLYRLFYRDYWWRVWVIQEITLARSIIILCGQDEFRWLDLVDIQETLAAQYLKEIDSIAHDRSELDFLRVSIESRGPRAMLLSTPTQPAETPNLMQTLLKHRFKESSDPKDMIYSLVGLSAAHHDPKFVVDYSKSVCQVYTDVVEYVVSTTRKLDVICAMPRGQNTYRLPSWVPDWSFNGFGFSFLEHSSKHQFSAAGRSNCEVGFSSKKSILHANGACLGSLTLLGRKSNMEDLEDENNGIFAFNEWHILLASESENKSAFTEAFCRNILYEKYPVELVQDWERKEDFLPWILGTFIRGIMLVRPDLELDLHFREYAEYRAPWRDLDEDDIMGMILVKGAVEMIFGRRAFMLDSKLIGLGPETAAEGDVVSVLLGCQLPVMLRPGSDHHVYLGEAFVNGYMYGKAMEELADGKRALQEFSVR